MLASDWYNESSLKSAKGLFLQENLLRIITKLAMFQLKQSGKMIDPVNDKIRRLRKYT
jgi:hypothetical protein